MSDLQYHQNFQSTLKVKFDIFLVFFVSYFVYLITAFPTVQSEDSGELITSAATLDLAHPPGYPLYVLIGKLFSLIIPFGNVAWRINIMSGFFAAGTVSLFYLLAKKFTKNKLIAMAGSFFFAFSNIFWSQSMRAEVYTLNSFLLALVIYLLYRWQEKEKSKWLYLSAFIYGLSLGNHHLMFLAAPAIFLFVVLKNWRVLISPKIVSLSLLLFALGLSVYAYLPLKTCYSTYDNPAFIDHSGLCTWDKFSAFVNRKIYGGTVNITTPTATQEATENHLPVWLVDVKDFFGNYASTFYRHNQTGFIPLLKITSREYFYFSLFFFFPGLYFLLKKNKQFAVFIALLFFMYSAGLGIYIIIEANLDSSANFGAHPFLMPIIFILGIISTLGYASLQEKITDKKTLSIIAAIFFLLPIIAVVKNFNQNDEHDNYIAYDFNKNALESIPQNGHFISVGRDNMTFPLYYLRKVEGIRPDINLEIYYSSGAISQGYLINALQESKKDTIFVDLVPPDFEKIGLKPYNFVFAYGKTDNLQSKPSQEFQLRGVKKDLDYPNSRLAALYNIKMALLNEENKELRNSYFDKVITQFPENISLVNFIGDYARNHQDFEQAKKAYQVSGNYSLLEKIEEAILSGIKTGEKFYQTGMN